MTPRRSASPSQTFPNLPRPSQPFSALLNPSLPFYALLRASLILRPLGLQAWSAEIKLIRKESARAGRGKSADSMCPALLSVYLATMESGVESLPDPDAQMKMMGGAAKFGVGVVKSVATMKLDSSVFSAGADLAGGAMAAMRRKLAATTWKQLAYVQTTMHSRSFAHLLAFAHRRSPSPVFTGLRSLSLTFARLLTGTWRPYPCL